jgi:type II secretory pathway component PulK
MIKGITPGMFYGSGGSASMVRRGVPISNRFNRRNEEPVYPLGFVDLFTTVSGRSININTASAEVLQLIPDVDGGLASAIIEWRNGLDGAQGDEDDRPFRSIGELSNVRGMTPQIAQIFARYFGTRSLTFEVEVEAEIDAVKRTYYAMLRRTGNGNQIVTLYMYWR